MNTIKVAGIKKPVAISHIMYVIGNGNYSDVYTDDGKHVLSSMTLKIIEEQSSELIRIHKGTLVNPDFIQKVSFSELVKQQRMLAPITMQDGKILAVARRRCEVLLLIKQPGMHI